MARVLLVSYHFPPSTSVGALRPGRLARLLPAFGYEVDVVCATAGHGEGHTDPSRSRLIPDGARVVRINAPYVLGRNPFEPPSSDAPFRKAWWKSRAYLEWLFFTKDWAWKWGEEAAAAVTPLLDGEGYDLLIADAPPNPSVVPAVRLGLERGTPTVLDLRDVWGFAADGPSIGSYLSPRRRRERWSASLWEETVRGADHVVLTSPHMTELARSWFPDLDPSRFSSVTNGFAESDTPGDLADAGSRGRCRIVYTGSLAYGRLEQAAALLRGLGVLRRAGQEPMEILFVGGGHRLLAQTAAEEGVSDLVEFQGWVEGDRATELQRRADALLLLQPPGQIETQVAIPGKLYDYMARRRNIMAMVGPGPAAEIILRHDLGVIAPSTSAEALADALRELAGRVERHPILPEPPREFSEINTVEAFSRILDQVLDVRGRDRP